MMRLKRFRITNFRSVDDSGWIEADNVTVLIGTNESGKTNILLHLWKLNPAKEGAIAPIPDYPRKRFNEFRQLNPKPVFVRAVFDAGDELAQKLSALTGLSAESVREVQVARRLDGDFEFDFPSAEPTRSVARELVSTILETAEGDIEAAAPLKTEEESKRRLISSLKTAHASMSAETQLRATNLETILSTLEAVVTDRAPKTSTIVPPYRLGIVGV